MTQVATTTRTFSKATKKQIVELLPTTRTFKKVYDGVLIKDENYRTLGTWQPRRNNNGIIVIH
jgi:hypothetical protein